jgi:CheY-like chemotaxis protein
MVTSSNSQMNPNQNESSQLKRTSQSMAAEHEKKKILVIEDELALSRVLTLKLDSNLFEVYIAQDGGKAEQMILEEKYDTILLDLILPTKNGFDLLPIIRKKSPDTKIIILTNLGQPEDRERVDKYNPEGYFVKSEITIFDLIQQINTIIAT